MQHLAPGAHQLIDRLDHMYRNPDGARLIGNRAGDRLTYPPCRIGAELIPTAIFKLINRLHQANIAFLNKIEKLQTPVSIFFGNRNHQPQIGLDHFFLGLAGFFFAFLHLTDQTAKFADIQADVLPDLRHIIAQILHLAQRAFNKHLPAATRLFSHAVQPVRIQFIAAICLDKFPPVDPRLIRQFHHRTVNAHDTFIDPVKLVNQRLNTVIVQVQLVYQLNNFRAQFLISLFLIFGKRPVFIQSCRYSVVLHFRQFGIIAGNKVKRFEHLRL